ncbi:MAG: glycosyltransferase family 1 protein [Candidatus Abyssobacteria bacterium SURF_5]|uniref:Glycosyltransferase family 1 protein n=1 Tax=Abyssobacteria bacterium (strain SURF_5) TaxID=2093360 RepID=A0A3A4NVW3_ABYX5|nr:MAG: glycosyltransferase family 1 protein [Candidatus Abyssubacteria bacterium SURF_5]
MQVLAGKQIKQTVTQSPGTDFDRRTEAEAAALTVLISDFHRHGGGHTVYTVILSKGLQALGHRPIVACPPASHLAIECAKNSIEVFDIFRFDRGFSPVSFYLDLAALESMKRKNRIDVLHVSGSRDHWTMAASNLFSAEKLPLVRTRHSTKEVRDSVFNRYLNRKLTHRTISVCHYVKEMLLQSPVFNGTDIDVIHNGVELEAFRPMPPDRRIVDEFQITPADFVIGIVGRLDWDKGHKYLFEAAAPLIKGEYKNVRILAVGFGRERENLEEMCRQLGIAHRVNFLGHRLDMRELISVFDIGVHPSIGIDTSSYAVKEMMAMEKPVVCSSYGGLKEIVEDGTTGYLVPPHDSAALRAGIKRMLDSKELRESMGRAARRRVEREFSAEVFARKTLRVYENALESVRKPLGSVKVK